MVKKKKGSKKQTEDDKCNGKENAAEHKNPDGESQGLGRGKEIKRRKKFLDVD